jgi:flagellar biosynthesis GTPase FlhF
MAALSTTSESATLIAFPGGREDRCAIAAALKAHRLPELLAAQLLRASKDEADPHKALAKALAARMHLAPLDLDGLNGILLIGASGAGKSTAAAAIAAAASREVVLLNANEGLKRLRDGALPARALVVMEAEGFHPLNKRACSAFAALNDAEGIETVGVVSAAGDAQDVGEMVAALRFKRLIVTGLDRTRRLGALTASVTSGARLAHLVRNGTLQTLTPAELAADLLSSILH